MYDKEIGLRPPANKRIFAVLMSPHARTAVARGASSALTPVQYYNNSNQIVEAAIRDPIGSVCIVEAHAGSRRDLQLLAEGLGQTGASLLVTGRLASSTIQPLLSCYKNLADCRVAVAGIHSIERRLVEIMKDEKDQDASLPVLTRIIDRLPTDGRQILAYAVVAGERILSVSELASLCAVSERTLELRTAACLGMRPKRLLMWALALHSSWRATRLEWHGKALAGAAGCASERALSNRVVRTTGHRLANFRNGDFEDVVLMFLSALGLPSSAEVIVQSAATIIRAEMDVAP
jgi:hypothetical protein